MNSLYEMMIRRSRGSRPLSVANLNVTWTWGTSASAQIKWSGSIAPTFSTSAILPAGITMTSDGIVAFDGVGEPPAGLHEFEVIATDGIDVATATVKITMYSIATLKIKVGVDTKLYLSNSNGVLYASPIGTSAGSYGGAGYHSDLSSTDVYLYPYHGLKYSIDGGATWKEWIFEASNILDLSWLYKDLISVTKVSGRDTVSLSEQQITISDPSNGASVYEIDLTMTCTGAVATIPTDYVFYTPLQYDTDDHSASHRTPTITGEDSIDVGMVQNGTACTYVPYSARIVYPMENIATGYASRTLSVWFYPSLTQSSEWNTVAGFGTATEQGLYAIGYRNGYLGAFTAWYGDIETNKAITREWHNLVATYDGSVVKLYLDGCMIGYRYINLNTQLGNIAIGGRPNGDTYYRCENAWVSQAIVYNRALSPKEIYALSVKDNYYALTIEDVPIPTDYAFHAPFSMSLADVSSEARTATTDGTNAGLIASGYSQDAGVDCTTIPTEALVKYPIGSVSTSTLTTSLWWYWDGTSAPSYSDGYVFHKIGLVPSGTSRGFIAFLVRNNSNGGVGVYLSYLSYNSKPTSNSQGDFHLTQAGWHNFTFTKSSSGYSIMYVDGKEAFAIRPSDISISAGNISYGGFDELPLAFYTTTCYSDAYIYNRVLSPSEIWALAHADIGADDSSSSDGSDSASSESTSESTSTSSSESQYYGPALIVTGNTIWDGTYIDMGECANPYNGSHWYRRTDGEYVITRGLDGAVWADSMTEVYWYCLIPRGTDLGYKEPVADVAENVDIPIGDYSTMVPAECVGYSLTTLYPTSIAEDAGHTTDPTIAFEETSTSEG